MSSSIPPGAGAPTQQDLLNAFEKPTSAYFSAKPSRTDLMMELRKAERPFVLYRYGKDWYWIEIGGQMYGFPPDLGKDETGKQRLVQSPRHLFQGEPSDPRNGQPLWVEADGIVVDQSGMKGIRTRYGIHRNLRDKNRVIGFGPMPGEGHTDIVMVTVDNHGEEGVVWLPGDETDEKRKAASKALYFRTIKVWAEEQDAARQQYLRNWNAISSNRGRIPPPPSAVQRKAVEILDEIRREARGGAEWICPHGCSDWKEGEFDKYANHMKVAHGKIVADPRNDAKGQLIAPLINPDVAAFSEEGDGELPPENELQNAQNVRIDPMAALRTRGTEQESSPLDALDAAAGRAKVPPPVKKGGKR